MPLIRKKTSNRGTTHERRKLTNKIRESKKKKKRSAKNNVQWKSKSPKDPGIPSTFPYKDQILAEVQKERRIAAEERESRKEARKAAKSSTPAEEADKKLTIQDVGLDGIASISARRLSAKALSKDASAKKNQLDEEEKEEEEPVPLLNDPSLTHLESVLDEADVLLQVLDARDPLGFRNRSLENVWKNKKGNGNNVILVLNKIDLCPKESIFAWSNHLRTQVPTLLFRSASAFLPPSLDLKGKPKPAYDDALGAEGILHLLSQGAKNKGGDKPFTVAVVGLTNSGKSSLINSLLKSRVTPIYAHTASSRDFSTTNCAGEVTIDGLFDTRIRIIDTPGLSLSSTDEEDEGASESRCRDILFRNRGRIDRLKDPSPPVSQIVSRASPQDLMLLYNLPAFSSGDMASFVAGVARSAQLVKKKGVLDTTSACRIVLRDWSTGKLAWFTQPAATPHSPSSPTMDTIKEDHYAQDYKILETLATKSELMKSGKGIVKLKPSSMEERTVVLDIPWRHASDTDEEEEAEVEENNAESSSHEMDGDSNDQSNNDDDDDDDEILSEQEEPPAPVVSRLPTSRKEKRKRAVPNTEEDREDDDNDEDRPKKNKKAVAFARGDHPKGSKQARKIGSQKNKKAAATANVSIAPTTTGSRAKDAPDEGGYDFSKFF